MKKLTSHLLVCSALLITVTTLSDEAAASHSWGSKYVNVPPMDWFPCFGPGPFECAIYKVPRDHSRASRYFYVNGAEKNFEIVLIRLPATDPDNKIGSLFLNPGGPGGSGVDFVLGAGPFLYTPEVRARFDIVSFDPRGTNRSAPLSCFTSFDPLDQLSAQPVFPRSYAEILDWLDFDKTFRKNCDKNAGSILDNMTTADVARDMDIFREAVGDKKLTYAGYSYGSFLGVTYANLFPKRVRALIVDAVLDPIQWTTGSRKTRKLPVTTRLRSDAGAQATLEEFFRLCDQAGPGGCGLSGDAGLRFEALLERADAGDLIVINPDGSEFVITYQLLVGVTLNVMYNTFDWAPYSFELAFLESLPSFTSAPSGRLDFLAKGAKRGDGDPDLIPQTIEAFPGVLCSDSNNPYNPFKWVSAANDAEREFGIFGPVWTWQSSWCARWPGSKSSRYKGPFTRYTANPVLVTGTEFDPATRFEGAVKVAKLLPNSQLLTVQGWGHTTLFLSDCATQIASDYLVDTALPPSATTCQQDIPPFGLAPGDIFTSTTAAVSKGAAVVSKGAAASAKVTGSNRARENRERAMRSIRQNRQRN